MKKIKVAIFVDGDFIPSYDGASNRFHYLSRYLSINGIEVIVFHGYRKWSDIDLIKKEPFKTYIFPISNYYDNLELIASILNKEGVDIIQFDNLEPVLLQGIRLSQLTGAKLDNEQTAKIVSRELGIDTYFANVLPEDKYSHIKELQDRGNIVLMVGDGVNDAPALTQANAGIAIGAGTDVTVESGDVVLMNNNPSDITRLIRLSKKVYSKMIQNLLWALGYNIIAIPAAAGIFAFWGFFLRPEIGALVMSLSTVIVVINALFLKRVKL